MILNQPIIREIKEAELSCLEDMLYNAIFQQDSSVLLPHSIINEPYLNAYINGFGSKKGGHCMIAILNEQIIGSVWTRILSDEIKGYGNIDAQTPEFAISLYKEYRNLGFGTLLMKKMIDLLKSKGYKQASLSVNKDNFAVKMYKNLGFKIIRENNDEFLMLLKIG